MRVSALEEYGIRCLLRVANAAPHVVAAQDVAVAERISVPYAQKIMRLLAKGGLVESQRGPNGGYALARPAQEISVGDALRALDEQFTAQGVCERHSGEDDVCASASGCSIHPMWKFVESALMGAFDELTLSVLLEGPDAVKGRLDRPRRSETPWCPVGALTMQ